MCENPSRCLSLSPKGNKQDDMQRQAEQQCLRNDEHGDCDINKVPSGRGSPSLGLYLRHLDRSKSITV